MPEIPHLNAGLEEYESFINQLADRTMKGGSLTREELLRLLAPSPDSPQTVLLGQKAREMAAALTGNRGRIWSAVGVDRRPCRMNCKFCSFGEKWGLIREESEWTDADVINAARVFVEGGVSWFVLRTTEFYSFEHLLALASRVRTDVPGDYAVVVNTGEFDPEGARQLRKAGVSGVYHTLRLGEGCCTHFKPAERLATLAAIRDSELELFHMVEPLGPEHSNEEIADRMLTAREYKSSLGGVMARINVKGTPYGDHPPVSEARKAQIVAVSRIFGGSSTPNVCAHPPARESLEWGANVVSIEIGAVPRSEQTEHSSPWNDFDLVRARELLHSAGYSTGA